MKPPASTISLSPETVGSWFLSASSAIWARRAVNSASSAITSALGLCTATNIPSRSSDCARQDLQLDAQTPCRNPEFLHILSCSRTGLAHQDRNSREIGKQLFGQLQSLRYKIAADAGHSCDIVGPAWRGLRPDRSQPDPRWPRTPPGFGPQRLLAGNTDGVPEATIMSTLRRTSSAAASGTCAAL